MVPYGFSSLHLPDKRSKEQDRFAVWSTDTNNRMGLLGHFREGDTAFVLSYSTRVSEAMRGGVEDEGSDMIFDIQVIIVNKAIIGEIMVMGRKGGNPLLPFKPMLENES